MADTGAHPGVRSLLARFESNKQNNEISPPSRGRSPINSDSSTTRPLSKVRASFVTVERTTQSPLGLGRESEQGESQRRLRSPFSPASERVSAGRKDFFPSANGADGSDTGSTGINDKGRQDSSESVTSKQNSNNSNQPGVSTDLSLKKPHPPEEQSKTAASTVPATHKSSPQTTGSTQKVAKLPVTANSSKSISTGKASKPATTTGTKAPVPASSEAIASKEHTPTNSHAKKSLSTSKHSRPSTNHASKAATSVNRASTPSRDVPTFGNAVASPGNRNQSISPKRRARLPASMTTPSLSYAAQGSSTASPSSSATTNASTSVTRKIPTTKTTPAGSANSPGNPTALALRKRTSRASLPHHGSADRSHSRGSHVGAKPVDEGFLARMMRPTASSASKAHDKIEVKSPPRLNTTRTPRKSAAPGGNPEPASSQKKVLPVKSENDTPVDECPHFEGENEIAAAQELVPPRQGSVEQPTAFATDVKQAALEADVEIETPNKANGDATPQTDSANEPEHSSPIPAAEPAADAPRAGVPAETVAAEIAQKFQEKAKPSATDVSEANNAAPNDSVEENAQRLSELPPSRASEAKDLTPNEKPSHSPSEANQDHESEDAVVVPDIESKSEPVAVAVDASG